MSTNFYLETVKCEACGTKETIHLGKRVVSNKTRFILHIFETSDWVVSDLISMVNFVRDETQNKGATIIDEYGIKHNYDGFVLTLLTHYEIGNTEYSGNDFT